MRTRSRSCSFWGRLRSTRRTRAKVGGRGARVACCGGDDCGILTTDFCFSPSRTEINQLGDEISRIIEEQRKLEARYEELIALRSQLKGLANKAKWKENQDEINRVAQELRQSTKLLCRNLKDNPNLGENMEKVQNERIKLEEVFSGCISELRDLTFSTLKASVQDHVNKEDSLNELIAKEREAQQMVLQLREDLKNETTEHQRDLVQRNEHIAQLKDELGVIRTKTQVEQKFLAKETRSRADCTQRLFQQHEHELEDNMHTLRKQLKIERRVNKETEQFLRRRIEDMEKSIQNWMNKWETEVEEKDNQIGQLRAQRDHARIKLDEMDAKYMEEMRVRAAREAADRKLVEEKEIQERLLARINVAATKIQASFKGYRTRKQFAKGKKKKRGKGKSAKGKGKGKRR